MKFRDKDEAKVVLLKIINKVFSIYNIDSVELKANDIQACPIKANMLPVKVADYVNYHNFKFELALYVDLKGTGKEYIQYHVPRKNIVKEHLKWRVNENIVEDIFALTLKTINSLLKMYLLYYISPLEVYKAYDESIEMGIVAISLCKKGVYPRLEELGYEICRLLQCLNNWANRTYEGRNIPFAFVFDFQRYSRRNTNFKEKNDNRISNIKKICEFLKTDASALVTDGITSYIEIGENLSYRIAEASDAEIKESFKKAVRKGTTLYVPLVPYRFNSFGKVCIGTKLGVVLTVHGDILFIKEGKLIFSKRNGYWYAYDYDVFNRTIFSDWMLVPKMIIKEKRQKENEIKMIYLTCLDVAFARTGGCLAICKSNEIKNILGNINPNDIHEDFSDTTRVDKHFKRHMLEKVIINKETFYLLYRKAKQEILGIDGATIITEDGKFITTGAIIDNSTDTPNNDMHGGARTKIARKLSGYGIAFKISADGYIECYKGGEHIY